MKEVRKPDEAAAPCRNTEKILPGTAVNTVLSRIFQEVKILSSAASVS